MAVFSGNGSNSAPSFTFSSDTNTGIFRPGTDQLGLVTNGDTRLFINETGQVGLGTNSPGNTLELVGDLINGFSGKGSLHVRSNNTGSNGADGAASIGFSAPYSSNPSAQVFYGAIAGRKQNTAQGNTSGYLSFYTSPSGSSGVIERVKIDPSGRVGIGITSPSESLEVAGNIHVSGADRSIFNRSNNALIFGTDNTERARIDSSGRLLVGTTNNNNSLFSVVPASSEKSFSTTGNLCFKSFLTYGGGVGATTTQTLFTVVGGENNGTLPAILGEFTIIVGRGGANQQRGYVKYAISLNKDGSNNYTGFITELHRVGVSGITTLVIERVSDVIQMRHVGNNAAASPRIHTFFTGFINDAKVDIG